MTNLYTCHRWLLHEKQSRHKRETGNLSIDIMDEIDDLEGQCFSPSDAIFLRHQPRPMYRSHNINLIDEGTVSVMVTIDSIKPTTRGVIDAADTENERALSIIKLILSVFNKHYPEEEEKTSASKKRGRETSEDQQPTKRRRLERLDEEEEDDDEDEFKHSTVLNGSYTVSNRKRGRSNC